MVTEERAETALVDLSTTHDDQTFDLDALYDAAVRNDKVKDTMGIAVAEPVINGLVIAGLDAVEGFTYDSTSVPTLVLEKENGKPVLKLGGIKFHADVANSPLKAHPGVKAASLLTKGQAFNGVVTVNEIALRNKEGTNQLEFARNPVLVATWDGGKTSSTWGNLISAGIPGAVNPQKQYEEQVQRDIDATANALSVPKRKLTHAGIQFIPGSDLVSGKLGIIIESSVIELPAPPLPAPQPA